MFDGILEHTSDIISEPRRMILLIALLALVFGGGWLAGSWHIQGLSEDRCPPLF